MREAIESFCARIGGDPLLVQGAGGNASWKDGDTLWVKASGTWLAEAKDKDIFVPVDLPHLTSAVVAKDFAAAPRTAAASALRPSIETLLHGLMPHAVVVHLHAVDVLAHLVREAFPASMEERLGPATGWIAVPYRKPGAELAQAIADGLAQHPQADIVMLQSHGVVIGGRDVAEVEDRLERLTAALAVAPRGPTGAAAPIPEPLQGAYLPVGDPLLNQLALDPVLFDRLERDWVIYPDHVVFLGPRPVRADSLDDFLADWPDRAGWPEILFLKGQGVFTASTLSDARLAQLRCYYDVLTRQEPQERLNALTTAQIAELLNWDAEKYRMSLSR